MFADLTRRSRGRRVGCDRIKSAFLAKRTREAVDKLQRQCDMPNRLAAIDGAAFNVTTLMEVRSRRKAHEDREAAARRDKILDWLTPRQLRSVATRLRRAPPGGNRRMAARIRRVLLLA